MKRQRLGYRTFNHKRVMLPDDEHAMIKTLESLPSALVVNMTGTPRLMKHLNHLCTFRSAAHLSIDTMAMYSSSLLKDGKIVPLEHRQALELWSLWMKAKCQDHFLKLFNAWASSEQIQVS